MSRQVFNAAGAATVGPYSHACAGGGLLYLSGQTPIDPSTGALVTGSIQAQTQQCLDNLFAVLDAAGLGPDDVINVQVYLVDMRDFTAMNEAYATRFAAPYPARTTIGVASLPLGANVEIGLIARTR
ncbi:RidA family protein [Tahibacter soli]|uniref:Rid family detoxifying hydrolase n=1 Tax=Tahibacter soli TaxID=2983605 RepID=A0A9X3YS31_9GAMM|nr:Rid family detoxifying hydrolase [Tahibacter soli]MDC8015968.1 Rid family detoxifying hydrolase [Tahibacter soli]